ncbi:uncharacterized protein LOC141567617 [Rhinolophus sinicus]|uniref:uncharacterized protein LOC141567617 n=1 Tax=Rhinolophus sinicus TaxID=89399 RepID=UPI003D7B4E02
MNLAGGDQLHKIRVRICVLDSEIRICVAALVPTSSQTLGVTTNTMYCVERWTIERNADVVSALGCVTVTLTTAEHQLWTNCLLLPLVIITTIIVNTTTFGVPSEVCLPGQRAERFSGYPATRLQPHEPYPQAVAKAGNQRWASRTFRLVAAPNPTWMFHSGNGADSQVARWKEYGEIAGDRSAHKPLCSRTCGIFYFSFWHPFPSPGG